MRESSWWWSSLVFTSWLKHDSTSWCVAR